jgi:hypothetical protein
LIINNLTNRRIRIRGYFYKIKFKLFSKIKSIRNCINPGFIDVVAYKTNFLGSDLIVNPEV